MSVCELSVGENGSPALGVAVAFDTSMMKSGPKCLRTSMNESRARYMCESWARYMSNIAYLDLLDLC
jgi:hypothetical protein